MPSRGKASVLHSPDKAIKVRMWYVVFVVFKIIYLHKFLPYPPETQVKFSSCYKGKSPYFKEYLALHTCRIL